MNKFNKICAGFTTVYIPSIAERTVKWYNMQRNTKCSWIGRLYWFQFFFKSSLDSNQSQSKAHYAFVQVLISSISNARNGNSQDGFGKECIGRNYTTKFEAYHKSIVTEFGIIMRIDIQIMEENIQNQTPICKVS